MEYSYHIVYERWAEHIYTCAVYTQTRVPNLFYRFLILCLPIELKVKQQFFITVDNTLLCMRPLPESTCAAVPLERAQKTLQQNKNLAKYTLIRPVLLRYMLCRERRARVHEWRFDPMIR